MFDIKRLSEHYVVKSLEESDVEQVYAMCQGIEFLKCILGFILLKKGIWLNNIVSNE